MVDTDLILQVQKNNKNSFRILFSTYKKKVYGTAFLILKDYQLAEDIVQETFLQVYLKISKLAEPQAFEGWLYKITVNLCLEALKKSKKRPVTSLEEYIELHLDTAFPDFHTPEEEVIHRDLQQCVLELVYSLPRQYAAILVLFYYNNFSIREISEILNCSEGNVKIKLFRARKSLEKLLRNKQCDILEKSKGGALFEHR